MAEPIAEPDARTQETIRQLAMFMQARDARQWGVNTDGTFTPSWEDLGVVAQSEYVTDATAILNAVTALGYVPARDAWALASAAVDAVADRLSEHTIDYSSPMATLEHITRLIRRDGRLLVQAAAPSTSASPGAEPSDR